MIQVLSRLHEQAGPFIGVPVFKSHWSATMRTINGRHSREMTPKGVWLKNQPLVHFPQTPKLKQV